MVNHLVIIGGGIIGVCTAYYLTEDERFKDGSIAVIIVEANEIASGASGKAGGFLALDWHASATASLARLSFALHQRLADELDGENVYGYRKLRALSACVRVTKSPNCAPLVDPVLSQLDLDFRTKPPSIGGAHAQWLQGPNLESVDVISDEDLTAQVHPKRFTDTLFERARARGVQYLKGRPISWDQGAKILTVETANGPEDLAADTLVLAAGPWSGRVAKQLLALDIPITHLPGHSILIRPREPLPAYAVFSQVYAPGVTGTPELFARPDGQVYVAGENKGPVLPDGTSDVTVDPAAISKLVKASAAISKSLAEGVVEVEQLCYRPVTPHGTPFVGVLKRGATNVFIAAGHGPWGITLGPGTGKVMAEIILDGAARSAEVSQLDPSRHISA